MNTQIIRPPYSSLVSGHSGRCAGSPRSAEPGFCHRESYSLFGGT